MGPFNEPAIGWANDPQVLKIIPSAGADQRCTPPRLPEAVKKKIAGLIQRNVSLLLQEILGPWEFYIKLQVILTITSKFQTLTAARPRVGQPTFHARMYVAALRAGADQSHTLSLNYVNKFI